MVIGNKGTVSFLFYIKTHLMKIRVTRSEIERMVSAYTSVKSQKQFLTRCIKGQIELIAEYETAFERRTPGTMFG